MSDADTSNTAMEGQPQQPETQDSNGHEQQPQQPEGETSQQQHEQQDPQQQNDQSREQHHQEEGDGSEHQQQEEKEGEEKEEKSPETLTIERGVKKMLSNMTREQITMLLVKAAVSHTDVFDSVKAMSEKDSTKLFVRELSFKTTSETLKEAFSEYGEVVDASVVEDRQTKKSRGYGFVTFKTAESARKALESTGKIIDGRATQVVTYAARAGESNSGMGGAGGKRPRTSYETPSRGYYPSSSSRGGYDDRSYSRGSSYRDSYRDDYYPPPSRDSYYDSRDRGYAREGYSSRPAGSYYPPPSSSYRGDSRAGYDRAPPPPSRYDSHAGAAGYTSTYPPPPPSSGYGSSGYSSY